MEDDYVVTISVKMFVAQDEVRRFMDHEKNCPVHDGCKTCHCTITPEIEQQAFKKIYLDILENQGEPENYLAEITDIKYT